MNTKTLFKIVKKGIQQTILEQVYTAFFQSKEAEFQPLAGNTPCEVFFDEIKSHFSEIEIFNTGKGTYAIGLRNADFVFSNSKNQVANLRMAKFRNSVRLDEVDAVDYLQRLDDAMLQWNTEFRQLCSDYADQIEALECERLHNCGGSDVTSAYLRGRITDMLLMARKKPQYRSIEESVRWIRENIGEPQVSDKRFAIKLQNMTAEGTGKGSIWLNINGTLVLMDADYLPMIQQIDECIPDWYEGVATVKREHDKVQKAKQIAANAAKALVRGTMREFGYDYNLDGNTLEVKLKGNRQLTMTLPTDELDVLKDVLNELPTFVAAVNYVPVKIKVSECSASKMWTKPEGD